RDIMLYPETPAALKKQNEIILSELKQQYIPFIVDVLASRGGIDLVIMYGSRARGDHAAWSDTDLLVCSAAFENMRVLDRTDILHVDRFQGALEIICLTPAEARRALDDFNPTMLDALQDGIVLHENGSLRVELENKFQRLKRDGVIQRVSIKEQKIWNVTS
nr:nucleotidyltransferase domain-containing protein [Candidatus Sigynarchaeota archaeon]